MENKEALALLPKLLPFNRFICATIWQFAVEPDKKTRQKYDIVMAIFLTKTVKLRTTDPPARTNYEGFRPIITMRHSQHGRWAYQDMPQYYVTCPTIDKRKIEVETGCKIIWNEQAQQFEESNYWRNPEYWNWPFP